MKPDIGKLDVRICCLSDHQMIYGIKTEVTNSDDNMSNIRQWLEINRLLGRQVRPHIQLLQTEDSEISDS